VALLILQFRNDCLLNQNSLSLRLLQLHKQWSLLKVDPKKFNPCLIKTSLRTFTSFHIQQMPEIPHKNTKMLLLRTDFPLEFVTIVVENITKQHVASSLKYVTFATSETILPRCAIAKRVRIRQHLHLTAVNQPTKLHKKTYTKRLL